MDQTATDRSAARRSKRRRALFAVLLGASFATLGAGAMSLAIFTDSDAYNGTWTSGTIILGVTSTTAFTAADILPGDTGNKTVQVNNTGTGALRYAMTSTADNTDGKNLRSQLTLTISPGTCAAPGAPIYSGPLNGASLGNVAQGAQTGDRNVASGGTDNLCFAWAFDIAAGNPYQAATTTATFNFAAEQTANNP
jgi:Camelysin metallo-endopeptidase